MAAEEEHFRNSADVGPVDVVELGRDEWGPEPDLPVEGEHERIIDRLLDAQRLQFLVDRDDIDDVSR